MKLILIAASLLVACAASEPASAWMRAGAWGGHASGGGGSWSATGARGSTASGGDGSWSGSGFRGGSASGGGGSWSGTGYRGGTASGGDGSWHATGAYGNTAYGGYDHYNGGYYGAYHPPAVVNGYSSGCYNCGGWNAGSAVAAGAAVGLAAGAVVGAAAASAPYVPPTYTVVPAGCSYSPVGGSAYYACTTGAWLAPAYGANGVYYRVVPTP
jgi:hypothetical protein